MLILWPMVLNNYNPYSDMCQVHNESTSVSSTRNVPHIMRQYPSMYYGCFQCAGKEAGLYGEMPSCVH